MTTFEDQVREYLALQASLLKALPSEIDLQHGYFNRLEPGYVTNHGHVWRYHGHGAGLTFERDVVILNVHVVPWMVDVLDAWRMFLYLESRNVPNVVCAGVLHAVEGEGDVAGLLEELVENGVLVRVDDDGPRSALYRLAPGDRG
jgi:hypothetical protein